MLLKVRTFGLKAGRPVAILPYDVAKWLNVHVSERIRIKKYKQKESIIAVVDVEKGINNDEIILSEEIIRELKLNAGDIVEVSLAPRPACITSIVKKLDGGRLSYKEIYGIMESIVKNELTEAEIAYFVSATYTRGMNMAETISLIKAMVDVGKRINFNNLLVIDKHCIGGIAGNRTTPIVVSIIAAIIKQFKLNAVMPKTSSRAITSAAGTADVIETLAKVEFDIDEIKQIVKKTKACLVWGGSLGLSPADDKIIQVERLLGLDPESQLLASIMSKKLAVNAKYVLIDIPAGKYAKVSFAEAKKLAEKFNTIAKKFNIKLKAVITNGEQPIGNGIGPALEMRDVLKVLKQKPDLPIDLQNKAVMLATEIAKLLGIKNAEKTALKMLKSGKAFEAFKAIIKAQQGKIEELTVGKFCHAIKAEKQGKVKAIDNKKINYIARMAGCPADKFAGIFLHKHVNDVVNRNEVIAEIFAESKEKLEYAKKIWYATKPFIIK